MTRITIGIPTYNRATLLKRSIQSALDQNCPNLRIVVADNASNDSTPSVVKSFQDPRIDYLRNETNLGLYRNWNRILETNKSTFCCILPDDDELRPGFAQETVAALETHPSAALAVAQVCIIDMDGQVHRPRSELLPEGFMSGEEYLYNLVDGRNWVLLPAGIMMRTAALEQIGRFDTPHSKHTIDLNLYVRMAACFGLVSLSKQLANVRIHEGQDTQLRYRSAVGTGPIATIAERIDAAAYLLTLKRAQNPKFRQWLSDRLLYLNSQRSELTQEFVPALNLSWGDRVAIAKEEIERTIPAGQKFILVDQASWDLEFLNHSVLPFPERGGQYSGVPTDDATAIYECERLRDTGARFIVFAWPAFWWLDYYSRFRKYLVKCFPNTFSNSRLKIFDLQYPPERGPRCRTVLPQAK